MSFVLIFRFMAGFQYIALEGSVDIDGDEKVDSIELAVFSLRMLPLRVQQKVMSLLSIPRTQVTASIQPRVPLMSRKRNVMAD